MFIKHLVCLACNEVLISSRLITNKMELESGVSSCIGVRQVGAGSTATVL